LETLRLERTKPLTSMSPADENRRQQTLWSILDGFQAYLLKYIQAVSANKTIVTIQRDESLIPVFLAMSGILSLSRLICETLQ